MNLKLEDKLADWIGSWNFVVWQTAFIIGWVLFNLTPYAFDPYPFIFLNLMLSLQATYTVPILMIHSNKMEEFDRAIAKQDHESTKIILETIKKLENKLVDKLEVIEETLDEESTEQ